MRRSIFTAAAAAAAAAAVYLSGAGCVFRRFFGIICPGCGMTRAVQALLSLDIKGAFMYHPMVFSLPLILLYIVKNGHVFGNDHADRGVLIAVGIGFSINYIKNLYLMY